MNPINFNTYDHNFCESTIYSNGQHPEYANAISSLFISCIGYKGLTNPHNNFSTIMLYSSLIINGITSCGYHYYNTIGWGLLDRMSMVLIAMSSTYLFIQHIHRFLIFDKWLQHETITKLIHVGVMLYFTVLFTIGGLHWENTFNTLFGLFLASLAVYMLLIEKHQDNLKIPHQIVNLGWTGVHYIFKSGIFWIITETFCNYLSIFKYVFGHVWWHVFVSFGGYLISLIPVYLHICRNGYKPVIIKYKGFMPFLDYAEHFE
jgi:hypothetical protein